MEEQILGFIAGILTTVAVLPQLVKSWMTKKVMDISPFMFVLLLGGVGLWVIYGIIKNDYPIILTNGISFLLNSSMLLLMLLYKSKD
ncbi:MULTISPECIES: SemiSWEET transporter [Aequorivita]|uniref:SemiSWEET transporter n=1 Tax=Aequorivita iocasae TaxID=2803865 RepID=A0ABX7DN46_9FLAO|nr:MULTISPECIES: SemiSWEET transporter [Aequorivita]QQX75495.1 SemiSWEET transporter [Aequorivita iocasae]UCA54948.1 SemiSWEET transporter [Aequorivita sp. F7]